MRTGINGATAAVKMYSKGQEALAITLGVFVLDDILSAHTKKIDLCVGWQDDLM